MNRRGKKVQAWDRARLTLKRKFAAAGIITCELRYAGCWFDNALSMAHSKKRRHIEGDEIYEVALLCVPCHQVAERLPESEMTDLIRKIIAARRVKI